MTRSSFRKFWNRIIKKVKASADELSNKSDGLQLAEQKIGFTPHMFRHVRKHICLVYKCVFLCGKEL